MKRRFVPTSATGAALPMAVSMAAVGIMATGICAVIISSGTVVNPPSGLRTAAAQDVVIVPGVEPSEAEAPVYFAPPQAMTVHAGLDDGAASRALTVQCAKARVMVRTGFKPCIPATGSAPVTIDLQA